MMPFHPLAVLGQIGNIRDDNIDAQQFGFRKHQAAVDDDDIVTPAYGHAVHPKLAQAPEGYDVQFPVGMRCIDRSTGCRRERPARAVRVGRVPSPA
jgi:hypothetical protein